jgi:SAM-dependent methyltransferase
MSDSRAREQEGFDARLFERLVQLEDESFWFRARNRLLVQLAAEITRPGDRLLEIGCGTGYVLDALVRECDLVATGTELYAEALAHARRRVPRAELIQCDARALHYEEAFDIVGAFDVLEHIDDDVGVLRALCRAVRGGGFLLVTVPQHPWLWSRADTVARHVRRYRREELVSRVREAGFSPLRVTSFVSLLLPVMMVARWRERFVRRERDVLADLTPAPLLNAIFERVLAFERLAIKRGLDLPVGGSLVLVARR